MKKLFLVGVKLMGIYFMAAGLMSAIAVLLMTRASLPSSEGFDPVHQFIIPKLIASLLPLAIGFFLTFFSDKFTDLISSSDELKKVDEISPKALLLAGISLIGLSQVITYGSQVVSKLPGYFSGPYGNTESIGVGNIIVIAISLFITLKPGFIASLIDLNGKKDAS